MTEIQQNKNEWITGTYNMKQNLVSGPQSPEMVATIAQNEAQKDYNSWRHTCLEVLGSQEMHLLSFGGIASYEGVVLLAFGNKKLWVEAEDHGWEMETVGQLDEAGRIMVPSQGVDTLCYNWIDLENPNYELNSSWEEYPENEIPGMVYAVQMFLTNNDPHYREYIYSELVCLGMIDNQNVFQGQKIV